MSLRTPLEPQQIKAAARLHRSLTQWVAGDKALRKLKDTFTGFDSLWKTQLKAVAINGLYGTNVLAIRTMADRLHQLLRAADLRTAGPDLVEQIAELSVGVKKKPMHFVSFAAKFAHFFINEERFPIYDSYARRMTWHHLGKKNWRKIEGRPYVEFVGHLNRLREFACLTCTRRDLDKYLWLAGLYRKYESRQAKAKDPQINAEALRLFRFPNERQKRDLHILMAR